MRAAWITVVLACGVTIGVLFWVMAPKPAHAADPAEGVISRNVIDHSLIGKDVNIEFQSYRSLNLGEVRMNSLGGRVIAINEGMVTIRTDGTFNHDQPVASVPTSSILMMWSGTKSDATTQP